MTESFWQRLMDEHGVSKDVSDHPEFDRRYKAAQKELHDHCIHLCSGNRRMGEYLIGEIYPRIGMDKHKLVDEVWEYYQIISHSVRILVEQGYLEPINEANRKRAGLTEG